MTNALVVNSVPAHLEHRRRGFDGLDARGRRSGKYGAIGRMELSGRHHLGNRLVRSYARLIASNQTICKTVGMHRFQSGNGLETGLTSL